MDDESARKRFLWGAVLTWTPWVPTLIGLSFVFRGMADSKATGLAVVAGGLAEGFVLWGVGAMIIGQVIAIVLLIRAFSPAHVMRSLFSVISIGLSVLMLALVGLFLWAYWYPIHHIF